MLIEFAIKNFLSFKNEKVLSMLAAKSVKECESSSEGFSNITSIETGQKMVRVASLYGANASGKSNLVKAMAFFRNMILNSLSNSYLLTDFSNNLFCLDEESVNEPSSFQMIFIIDKVKYRYGFEIFDNKVSSEWLFQQEFNTQKESYCFKRENETFHVNPKTFKAEKAIESMTRSDALFLSTAAQFNVPVAMLIKNWFGTRFNILSGINDNTLNYTALQYLQNESMRECILDFIKIIDLGIQDISVTENVIENNQDSLTIPGNPLLKEVPGGKIKELHIRSSHNKYRDGELIDTVSIPFQNESIGTVKIFALLGPWFDTLTNGGILIVDEFGSSIHTKLAMELIKLFQSRLNTGNAQLVITTHDTNLLRKDLLRRDQIWFTEKDSLGISDLYSLVEYKINQTTSVRNDATFNRDYLLGKYGAIPYFGNIGKFISDYGEEEMV